MYIAICDDDAGDEAQLHQLIGEYYASLGELCCIDSFSSSHDFLQNFSAGKYDLVFLDIYMDTYSGIDLAHAIRQIDPELPLVFATSCADFALEGFAVGALHYLVKPVTSDSLREVFQRCHRLQKPAAAMLEIIANRLPVKVPLASILYIDVYAKLCTLHCRNRNISTYMSLDELEQRIHSPSFLRTHRSYLVNMDCIHGIETDAFRLSTGELVPIRQQGRSTIKQTYMQYILQVVRSS